MPWKCFVAEDSGLFQRSFRRYSSGSECRVNPHAYHNVEAVVDAELPAAFGPARGDLPDDELRKDPRWPRECPCGYRFHPLEDSWQVNVESLYRGAPDGKLYRLRELPPGAMWDAYWFCDTPEGRARYAGPDGKAWCLMTPCGVEWIVYGPSSNGGKWQVTGVPPQLTASPSIGLNISAGLAHPTRSYHGFLRDGVLTEDQDGRTFPGVARTA